MMKQQLEAKRDYKTKIIRFLTDEDPAPLGSEEEKVLARWEHADHLMRQHLDWSDMILKLTHKFSISKYTAENDIACAQEVFARSRKINKKYVVHLNLQRIEKLITFIEKKLYEGAGKDENGKDIFFVPDHNDVKALAKLYEIHTYTANSLPSEIVKKNLPPPIFMFNIVAGKTFDSPMSLDDALRAADEMITDAEIVPDDE